MPAGILALDSKVPVGGDRSPEVATTDLDAQQQQQQQQQMLRGKPDHDQTLLLPEKRRVPVVKLKDYTTRQFQKKPEKRLLPWPGWVSARMHGILMVSGFVFLAPSGVLCARYLHRRDSVWFKLHTKLMYGAVASVFVALVLALYDMYPINAPYWHGQVTNTTEYSQ
eukprot:4944836-Pyramimonas_sp.AAC.2